METALDSRSAVKPLSFEPISLSQKIRVESIRKEFGNTLYLYAFASLFAWKTDEKYEICFCDNAFIVKNGAAGDGAYLFPCGADSDKRKLIDALLQYEKPVFYSVTDEDKLFLESEYPGSFVFDECRDEFPYLYDKNAQIELKGKPYRSLRHQINVGRAFANEWTHEPLTEENIQRALAINDEWLKSRDFSSRADTVAAETALQNFTELSMWGLLFQADGEDAAYIAGTFVTDEIFDVSFCKVLNSRTDCYIKWALYCALPEEVKTVDSEEDLGIEGLRAHKLQRQPKELTRIWKGSLSL